MFPAPDANMSISHQKPSEALTSKITAGAADQPIPMRGESAEQEAQQGAARRSFARRIDCSGWDAARGPARGGPQPPPRSPNGRNSPGGGQAA